MPKEPTKRETKKLNLLKLIQKKTQELKENIRYAKQANTPFKILLCVVDKREGPLVAKFLNERKIDVQLITFAKDYSPSTMRGVLALDEIDQDLIVALVSAKKATNLLQDLSAEFAMDETTEHKFACLMPPSSATLETIKLLINNYKKPIQL